MLSLNLGLRNDMVNNVKKWVGTLLMTKATARNQSGPNVGSDVVKGVGQYVPPGHYYSPIPFLDEIQLNENAIFGNIPRVISGIDLNENEQLALWENFKPYYRELPFPSQKTEGLRYFFENPSYSYSDAIFLYCMIRHVNPGRIIEIGSGYSSCLMLDTNDLHFGGSIAMTFIDPYPELLLSLLQENDRNRIELIGTRVQEVDLEVFKALEANDILFIDSTHVSKIYSDVNRIFFDVCRASVQGSIFTFTISSIRSNIRRGGFTKVEHGTKPTFFARSCNTTDPSGL